MKDNTLIIGLMIMVVLLFGSMFLGLHYSEKMKHNCAMELSKQERSADEIAKICNLK